MFFEEILRYIIPWWFLFFVLGLINFPLTSRVFKNFPDKGYIFSKILAILFITYAVYIIGLVTSLPVISTVFLFMLMAGLLIVNLKFFSFKNLIRQSAEKIKNWWLFILEEVVFLLCLIFWSYIRGSAPDIHGLEKFMDFGFINSIITGQTMPPRDMWLAGSSINYYYFGHLYTAVLTLLSGIPTNVTYNLMIATIFGLCFVEAFSIGFNLCHLSLNIPHSWRKPLLAGLLTALLVTLAGNLHIFYVFTNGYPNEQPVPIWTLLQNIGWHPETYWYPNATRFIPFTIHEFPMYSYVVSDLHGHVLSIPIVLCILAFLLHLITKSVSEKVWSKISHFWPILLLSFLVATAYMTNSSDLLVYGGLTSLIIFAIIILKRLGLQDLFITGVVFVLGIFVFSLPFNLGFDSFVKGLGWTKPQDRSPFWMLLMLWGQFYIFTIPWFVLQIKNLIRQPAEKIQNYQPADIFVIILILFSTGLIIFPEFWFFKDIYPAHYRANTMFKLGYQAFMMLYIASVYAIFKSIDNLKNQSSSKFICHFSFIVFNFVIIAVLLIYPFLATRGYYGIRPMFKGLDGTVWISEQYPNDWKGILWLNENEKLKIKNSVILEAVGESYTDYARVSAHTGLSTVLGWPVHEWLWHGSYDEAGKRTQEILSFYNTSNLQSAKDFLKKYNVKYVFVGTLERQKYPNLNEGKLLQLGKVVFNEGMTNIYEIN